MEILGLLAIIFLLIKSGALNSLGVALPLTNGAPAPALSAPPPLTVQAQPFNPQQFQVAQQGTAQLTASVTNSLASAAQNGSELAGSLAKAVPIVGAAISTLIGVFAAASAKRAAEARSENQAVANAFPAWDAAVVQIQNWYNAGTINRVQVFTILDALHDQYWNEVGPQVQPGRNGCQSGQMSKAQADSQFPGMKQCSGSWGAGCCVWYADLANGDNSIRAAVTQTDNTGSPAVASIPAVFASKYGGANRAAYTLTFKRPSTTFIL